MAFTKSTATINNISSQPDKPVISATALKALFDKYSSDDKTYINSLIDELEAVTSAANLGAVKASDGTSTTIQAEMNRINSAIVSAVLGVIPDNSITDSKLTTTTGIFIGTNQRGTITLTSQNLNSVPLKSGFYYCVSATNKPTGFGNGYLIHVQATSSNVYSTQTYIDETNGRISTRVCTNNGWKAWKEGITETFGDVGGTNLDSFITGAEVYGSNFTNAPLSDSGYFYIKINGYQSSDYARQEAIKLAGTSIGRKWERVKNAGTWESWTEIPRIITGTSTIKTYLGVSSGEWFTPTGNAKYKFGAHCTVVGATVTTADKVNIYGATLDDFVLGEDCGIADFTQTSAGANTVTIFAQSLPTSNINILCEVVKG